MPFFVSGSPAPPGNYPENIFLLGVIVISFFFRLRVRRQVSASDLRDSKTVMDTQELNNAETKVEDLTVGEDIAAEVKGGDGEARTGRISITSFNFMKKADKP